MASAARSPSIWLFSFCLTISSAVSVGTFAFCSAALTSACDMNGTPSASWVCACDTTLLGTLGLFSMPVRNDAVIAEMSRAGECCADRRAELGAGVLEPADLAALLVGYR